MSTHPTLEVVTTQVAGKLASLSCMTGASRSNSFTPTPTPQSADQRIETLKDEIACLRAHIARTEQSSTGQLNGTGTDVREVSCAANNVTWSDLIHSFPGQIVIAVGGGSLFSVLCLVFYLGVRCRRTSGKYKVKDANKDTDLGMRNLAYCDNEEHYDIQ